MTTKSSPHLLGGCIIFSWIRSLLSLVLFYCCSTCYADVETQPIFLSIKPGLCVLGENETQCQDRLHIKWKANMNYSLCLYQQEKIQSLHCWQSSSQGEYHFDFVASENTQFQLRDSQTQQILAVTIFKILINHDNNRHRRRNPWSFF